MADKLLDTSGLVEFFRLFDLTVTEPPWKSAEMFKLESKTKVQDDAVLTPSKLKSVKLKAASSKTKVDTTYKVCLDLLLKTDTFFHVAFISF